MSPQSIIIDPSILPVRLAALQVAQSKIGMEEEKDPKTGRGLNTGVIYDWATEGMTTQKGHFWCAFFYCQAHRRVLLERIAKATTQEERAYFQDLLSRWKKIATGDCDLLWKRMTAEGWTWLWMENGRLPEPGDGLFYIHVKDGERVYHRDATPNLRHVAFITEFSPPDVHDLSGNHADQVGPHKTAIKDIGIHGCVRIPW